MKERRGEYRKPLDLSVPGVYTYTLGIALLCWITGYIFSIGYPLQAEETATPLWNYLCTLLTDKTLTYLAGFTLMAGSAFLIQRANYVLALIREKTFLPFVLYIFLISTNPSFFPLKSTSIGIFCLILAVYFLFKSYHDTSARESAYKIALLIAAGSLLWVHLLWFVPLFWYGMYTMKTFHIKTFIAFLLGLFTVYWFLLAWCIWKGDYSFFIIPSGTLWKINLLTEMEGGWSAWAAIILVAVLTCIAIIYILTHKHEESLRTRQYLDFLMVFAVFSFLLFFLYEQSSEEFLITACLPASILLAHFFAVNKGRVIFWGYQLFVTALIAFILIRLWSFSSNMGI